MQDFEEYDNNSQTFNQSFDDFYDSGQGSVNYINENTERTENEITEFLINDEPSWSKNC